MEGLFSRDVVKFVAVVVAGGLLLLTHWAVARRLFGDPTIGRPLRWLAWFPPLTPLIAFYEGKRTGAYLWIFALLGYVITRWWNG